MTVAEFPPIDERRLTRLLRLCAQLDLTAADLNDLVDEAVRLACGAAGCQGDGGCAACVQESMKVTGQDIGAQLSVLADAHPEADLEATLATLAARRRPRGRLSDAA